MPIVQMCIRMIPPDDVSFGTTSTTQASPITTEQCTTSSCQATMTTPEEETPETSAAPVTMAPTLCTTCDIAAIAPVMEANTVFENTNTVGTDGCTQTNAICRRTDDQVCTGVTLSATNAAGTSTISSAMNANQVSGLLTCQADGDQLLDFVVNSTIAGSQRFLIGYPFGYQRQSEGFSPQN
ncbi:hypothetical protein CRE_23323 [Caenorhabditis remanei]|uniref:DUF281 domain-containing protein n=1 Tax=Caenorhabditis remanei TaxID=31234 RepID=E3MGR5_CAERE|nr:hypothetical protein CRE_23323 [Caenorhabditis remanei]